MKVAAVYSGIFRKFKDWKENHKKITNHCTDVFYTTWEGREKPDTDSCITFKEPTVDYMAIQSEEFLKEYPHMIKHWDDKSQQGLTKQILAHQYACDYINAKDFNVIIRMRYDTWFGDHDWKYYIEKCYYENKVIAFGNWVHDWDWDIELCNKLIEPTPENGWTKSKIYKQLLDFMIMHPGYKMKGSKELHEKKKLFTCNFGWKQVLEDPYPETPINIGGGVMLTRYRHLQRKRKI